MSIGKRRLSGRGGAVALAAALISVALVGCSTSASTTSSSSGSGQFDPTPYTMSSSQLNTTMKNAFLTNSVKPSDLNPIVLNAVKLAGRTYSSAQISKANACLSQTTCTIGKGSQTIAELDADGRTLWRQVARAGITLQATAYPNVGHVIYLQAAGDLQTMQADLKTLIAKHVTGIVTLDDFGPAMTGAFAQAKAAGIPIVPFNTLPGAGAKDAVVTQVSSDLCQDGNAMAKAAKQLVGSKGNVAVYSGTPGNLQGVGWQKCVKSWFAANAPGLKVVNTSSTSWTDAGTIAATSALIGAGTKIDAIMYDYANQVPDIVQTYQKANLQPPAQITWTFENGLAKLWEQGQTSAKPWKLAYSSSFNWVGNVALTALMEHLAGKTIPASVTFPLPFVVAQKGAWVQSQPDTAPGPTLVPTKMLNTLLSTGN